MTIGYRIVLIAFLPFFCLTSVYADTVVLTREIADKINIGMTLKDVESIIGKGTKLASPEGIPERSDYRWKDSSGKWISVAVDGQGKVTAVGMAEELARVFDHASQSTITYNAASIRSTVAVFEKNGDLSIAGYRELLSEAEKNLIAERKRTWIVLGMEKPIRPEFIVTVKRADEAKPISLQNIKRCSIQFIPNKDWGSVSDSHAGALVDYSEGNKTGCLQSLELKSDVNLIEISLSGKREPSRILEDGRLITWDLKLTAELLGE